MPELPEVETVRRGMESAIQGHTIKSVQIKRHDLRVRVPDDFGQHLTGRRIESLTRRGKYIIMEFHPAGRAVILHLGMSGRIRIFKPDSPYVPRKHDHIIVRMDDSCCFAFEDPRRFGMMYIAPQESWQADKPFAAMGAEPLEAWSAADLLAKLHNKKTNIKTALLDQRVVAGLGNIYVCEALYYARINPARLSHTITPAEAHRIVSCCQDVLRKAIEAGGSTLRDYQLTDGSLGYFQYRFAVYDRADDPCQNDQCDSQIIRIVQAGRSTFYCPACQK